MDNPRGSYCVKRSFSELQATSEKSDDDDALPVKKKLRTKLVDLFNRASICLNHPEDHMKVYLRIKPFTQDEDSSQKCLAVAEADSSVVAEAPEMSNTFKSMKRGLGKSSHKFTFSRIFSETTSQADFFNETMLSMTKDFISGQNSLVFTYGVTSSGKTYTIQGKPQDAGILPRCLDVIFNSISGKQIPNSTLKPRMFTDVVRLTPEEVIVEKKIKEKTLRMSVDDDTRVMTLLGDEMESVLSDPGVSGSTSSLDELLPEVENRDREELKIDVEDQGKIHFGVWVSFAEIYNEQIFDLLEPMPQKKNARRPVLKICDDKNGNPYIKGLKEIHVDSADEAYRLLTIGQRNLQTACTRLNHCSSRSHCIFNIKIVRVMDKEDPHIARVSMLSLCDLAGSERYSKTQATGDRLKEAGNINTSLMTLGRCIETLRHNQLHRDQQRLVPFRDSKLTRLLQNFFNGSGRAAMIVNVSQCARMFDETLHVFKFSAIAKQVKYIEKPREILRPPKEKKVVLPAQRPSIAWETQEHTETSKMALKAAQNDPLPDDDDEGESDSDENGTYDLETMKCYIKTLEMRNERLVEMVQEEITNASNVETRVRQEVVQAMMQQVVNIEETYSTLLKETSEEAQEMADERVKGIMEVYEQRLERIQKRVDEEDEWVSSLLFHQEQVKVQERDARIADLEKQITQLKEEKAKSKKDARESEDIGNAVLVETLTQKLQVAMDASKEKDGKIEELESLIAEAGEVYNKHMKEIAELTESNKQLNSKVSKQLSSLEGLQQKLDETTASLESLRETHENKQTEWKSQEEEWTRKLKSQEATVSSLQEECKELQEEIERLQDQMSQLDEQSRYRNELDSSAVSCNSSHGSEMSKKKAASLASKEDKETEEGKQESGKPVSEKEQDSTSKEFVKQIAQLQEDLQKKCSDLEAAVSAKDKLEQDLASLQTKNEALVTEASFAKENREKSEAALQNRNGTIDELKKKIENLTELEKQDKDKLESLQLEKEQLLKEIETYRVSDHELCEKLKHLEEQVRHLEEQVKVFESGEKTAQSGSINITSLVHQIEQKTPVGKTSQLSSLDVEIKDDSDDSEIVFNPKSVVPAAALTPKTPLVKEELPDTYVSPQIAMKLKDAELANAALRKKLKREEEDFFKREQALIHGYTAEIENLKYEMAKLKSKTEGADRLRQQRSQRKGVLMDTSSSSAVSESVSDTSTLLGNVDEQQSTAVLSSELAVLQQQILSMHAAYRKLQSMKEGNETNSFIQDVVMGSPGKRKSTQGVFRTEDNIADSVLQFEIEEYAIKLDEMRLKISQQDEEFQTLKTAFEKVNAEKQKVQNELDQLSEKYNSEKVAIESKTTSENNARKDIEEQLSSAIITKTKLETEVKQQESMTAQLKETLENTIASRNDMEQEMLRVTTELDSVKKLHQESEAELKALKEGVNTLTAERDQLRERVENLTHEKQKVENDLEKLQSSSEQVSAKVNEAEGTMASLKTEIQSLKEDLNSKRLQCECLELKVTDAVNEKESTEKKMKEFSEEFNNYKEKLLKVEKKCKEMAAAVGEATLKNEDFEREVKSLNEKLATKEAALMKQEQELKDQLVTLKQQYCNEGETKAETITKLQQMVEDMKTELKSKTTEMETIKCQRQEEAAEVSQKLIMLEREKKVAERKATEAKERENEWQMKCQGLDRLKQLEHQLHEQLRTAAESVRKHSKKTSELMEELISKNKELEELREEVASLKTHSKKSEDLQLKIKELEHAIATEKELKLKAQNGMKEYCQQIETLKTELRVSEETMEQQENIINKQDGELESLRTEINDVTDEKEKLYHHITEKDLQISSLNKQVSKLEDENKSLKQVEKKSFEVEQREKISLDQLQKTNSEKGALEERITMLEKEKQSLEGKLENANKQISDSKKEMEETTEKLGNTEKLKKGFEKDVQRLIDKLDVLEEELEKARQSRVKDLEHSQHLEGQLRQLRKEMETDSTQKSKQNVALDTFEKENKSLKEELHRLKNEIENRNKELSQLQERLRKTQDAEKNLEKDLQKQERINLRNREEMENWKKERDACVSKLEQLITKRQETNKQLTQENEQLKKDNADLAQNVANVTTMKDSVIADLRKVNNTLSIQLAGAQCVACDCQLTVAHIGLLIDCADFRDAREAHFLNRSLKDLCDKTKPQAILSFLRQGMSPPPKMDTPDNSIFRRREFIEDLDTTGHLEMDATPPIAAKKLRKMSSRQSHTSPSSSSSSVDPEVFTPARKSLKPIEEQNESSPHTPGWAGSPNKGGFQSAKGRVAELASDVLSSISPLTRSSKRRQEKKKTTIIQPPFDLPSYVAADEAQNENAHPYGTRRSSRLKTKSKHSHI